jgi:phosphoribosylaminoimidazolecarboxamide formyltransferase/IMP cyclohydrolase
MVVVNLYAFEKTAAREGVHFEELIENIDIGGPSMIRSAAKNFQDVAVVTSPSDYRALAEEMAKSGGELSSATKWRLSAKGVRYYGCVRLRDCIHSRASECQRALRSASVGRIPADAANVIPESNGPSLRGNPHQKAAMYSDGSGKGVANGQQLQGKELSYNNIVDMQAAWDLAQEFEEPVVAIIKHHQPLRHGYGKDPAGSVQESAGCDPVSAFGGVIGVNRVIDGEPRKKWQSSS